MRADGAIAQRSRDSSSRASWLIRGPTQTASVRVGGTVSHGVTYAMSALPVFKAGSQLRERELARLEYRVVGGIQGV